MSLRLFCVNNCGRYRWGVRTMCYPCIQKMRQEQNQRRLDELENRRSV